MDTNTQQQIKAEIRELKRDMKARGIRVTSCMNGGLSREEYAANATLFRLKTQLGLVQSGHLSATSGQVSF